MFHTMVQAKRPFAVSQKKGGRRNGITPNNRKTQVHLHHRLHVDLTGESSNHKNKLQVLHVLDIQGSGKPLPHNIQRTPFHLSCIWNTGSF